MKPLKSVPMKPRYSGPLSNKFWAEVGNLVEPDRSIVYALGVVLQDIEGHVLRYLAEAPRQRPKKGKKKP